MCVFEQLELVCVCGVCLVWLCVFLCMLCVCVCRLSCHFSCVFGVLISFTIITTHTHTTHIQYKIARHFVTGYAPMRTAIVLVDTSSTHTRSSTPQSVTYAATLFRTVFLKDIPAGKQTHTQKDTQDNDNKTSELSIAISKLFYYLRDNHGTDSALEFLDTIHGAWRTLTTNTVIGYFSKFLNNEEVASDVAHTSLDAQSEYSVLYERSAEFYVEKGLQVCVCVCMCGVCIYGLVCFLVGLSYA